MGTFSMLFRMVLASTPPIFSFLLIFSYLFPISTGLQDHLDVCAADGTSTSLTFHLVRAFANSAFAPSLLIYAQHCYVA